MENCQAIIKTWREIETVDLFGVDSPISSTKKNVLVYGPELAVLKMYAESEIAIHVHESLISPGSRLIYPNPCNIC